jgi:hypothetical protein
MEAGTRHSTESEDVMNTEVVPHLDTAFRSLESFKASAVALWQSGWQEALWSKVDQAVEDFCKDSQSVTMTIGGFDEELFDRACEVLGSFVTHAEDLMQEARRANGLPSEEMRDRIKGVVDRCKARVREIDQKRADIAVVRKAIAVLTGCDS